MELNFNNGKKLEITSSAASSGILTIRMLQQNIDDLQKIFSDELGTKIITVHEDGKEDIAYENYTQLSRISVYTGGIYEVEMRQKEASTDTKIADNTAQLTETQEAIADIYARLDAIDEQLAAKSEKEVTE